MPTRQTHFEQPQERADLRKKLLDDLHQAKLTGTILDYSSSSDLLSAARGSVFDVLFLETVFPESTGHTHFGLTFKQQSRIVCAGVKGSKVPIYHAF